MIFREVIVMQPVEKLEEEGLRRSGRIPKEVAILLIGCDAQGKEFMEQTKTVVLSRHGAGIVSMHKLAVEQEMIMQHVEGNKEAEVRVVGQIGSEDGSYTYGVAFLDPDIGFWGVQLPAATGAETSARRMVLQCSICGCREGIDPGGFESDIYAIRDGIVRYCQRCNSSTLWKHISREFFEDSAKPEALPIPPDPAPPPEPSPSPAPFKNRRQHVRIKVSFTASVRNHSLDDDIVLCENISRSGLCFRSSRRYYETAGIEVAVPYSPGSPRIPVPAQIVYVQELPQEKMFRYGVRYLHLTKDPRS